VHYNLSGSVAGAVNLITKEAYYRWLYRSTRRGCTLMIAVGTIVLAFPLSDILGFSQFGYPPFSIAIPLAVIAIAYLVRRFVGVAIDWALRNSN
jgi:hypothetical protein